MDYIKDNKIEVLTKENNNVGCILANGILICRCEKCKPKEYELPEDMNKLRNFD